MSLILTRAQVRDVDRRAVEEYGMSGLVLMENAGRGCADFVASLHLSGAISIFCGKGNNGGDGFVIARHLDNHGAEVNVLVFCEADELRGDARVNYEIVKHTDVGIEHFPEPSLGDDASRAIQSRLLECHLIIDALLGTGTTGPTREPLATAIRLINQSPARRLAVDIPSGLDCDTGEAAEPTVVADHTCTFVALKRGMLTPTAARHCGEIHVVDIGVPRKLLAEIVAAGEAS
jgi:NAD(P)H-hydrate epimerase